MSALAASRTMSLHAGLRGARCTHRCWWLTLALTYILALGGTLRATGLAARAVAANEIEGRNLEALRALKAGALLAATAVAKHDQAMGDHASIPAAAPPPREWMRARAPSRLTIECRSDCPANDCATDLVCISLE